MSETQIPKTFAALFIIWTVLCLVALAGAVVIAVHFIGKLW